MFVAGNVALNWEVIGSNTSCYKVFCPKAAYFSSVAKDIFYLILLLSAQTPNTLYNGKLSWKQFLGSKNWTQNLLITND